MATAKKPVKPSAKGAAPQKASAATKKPRKAKTPAAVVAPSPPASKHAIGEHVTHPMFGNGTVRAIEADKLTIEFGNGVIKQIVDYS